MRLRPCGDAALLVELGDLGEVLALAPALDAGRATAPYVTDVVPAARTILVRFDPSPSSAAAVAAWIRERSAVLAESTSGPGATTTASIEVPVVYDGADLDEVGRLTGLGRAGVIEAH